jgi:hypothetical protein
MDTQGRTASQALLFVVMAPILAGVFAAGVGGLAAKLMPEENWSSWGWWLALPVWLILEIVFGAFIEMFGAYSKYARVLAAISALVGFTAAWIVVR